MFADAAVVLELPGHAWRERWGAMAEVLKGKLFEIVIAGALAIVLALNGIILTVVINNSRALGIVEGSAATNAKLVAANTGRIHDIASALRLYGLPFAWEAVHAPFSTALLVTKPVRKSGAWKIRMSVLDGQGGSITAYEAKLRGRDDLGRVWALGGSIRALDGKALSIEQMEAFAREEKLPLFAPAYIDKKASFIVYQDAAKVNSRLQKLGYAEISVRKVPRVDKWEELVAVMHARGLNLGQFKGKPRKGKSPPPPAP